MGGVPAPVDCAKPAGSKARVVNARSVSLDILILSLVDGNQRHGDEIDLAVQVDAGIESVIRSHVDSRRLDEKGRAVRVGEKIEQQPLLRIGAGAPGKRIGGVIFHGVAVTDGVAEENDHPSAVGFERSSLTVPGNVVPCDSLAGGGHAGHGLTGDNLLGLRLQIAIADHLLELYRRARYAGEGSRCARLSPRRHRSQTYQCCYKTPRLSWHLCDDPPHYFSAQRYPSAAAR